MQVNVVNVFRTDGGIFQSKCYGARRFFWGFAHAHTMEGFAGGTISCDFGIDAGASSASVFVVFQHEHPGSFCQHEAIAIGGKWPRCALRGVVPGLCKTPQRGITLNDARCATRIYAAY